MSDTKSKIPPKNRATYVVYGNENENELKIKGSNEQPLNVLNVLNMEISCGGYKIEKDPKTGKILRVQDGRTLSEMQQANYDKLIKKYKENEKEER